VRRKTRRKKRKRRRRRRGDEARSSAEMNVGFKESEERRGDGKMKDLGNTVGMPGQHPFAICGHKFKVKPLSTVVNSSLVTFS
jgi:hypothetical protein